MRVICSTALLLASTTGTMGAVHIKPVAGNPCRDVCSDAPASEGCSTCCRTVDHEVPWHCGEKGGNTAECCNGAWDAKCWDTAGKFNFFHACASCNAVRPKPGGCTKISTNYRCKGAPNVGGWDGLNAHARSADDCAKACLAVASCKYAVYRPANHGCTSFGECDEFKTNDPNGPFTVCAVRPSTLAPVTGSPVAVLPGVSGDPFTTDGQGKRVQFFLPIGRDVSLLTCTARWGGFELLGRVMPSGIAGDHQQWFDRFVLRVDGEDKVSVSIRDSVKTREVTNETKPIVVDNGNDVVAKAGALARNISKGQSLSMIDVGINYDHVMTPITQSMEVAHDGMSIDVSQSTRPNTDTVESVHFESAEVSVDIKTALASKMETKTMQKLYRHLDIAFVRLDKVGCSAGVLAELWGFAPMSAATTAMLQPRD